ncbi:zinc-binding dehydrogenase [Nocardia brasiliensis]|uniref:alcohol dehydrogenase n=1 Tax=Nocardia brasiliensis (strain ATCC 700358 / HUJEG-1) TaxID=1133849 RepID=K0F0M8_NOCB7|nr:zinc-binding dehydrogenase [Nocardia brasiliensis]AFU02969.1 alcohol dehydrogenase [Nocardia brasiliensis ATCC 700358]OCF86039.1 dehydrogenase [Nocardia brasiliensis]
MDSITPRVTRAAVWTGHGVELREIELPDLAAGDTLVRVRLATVCGSDLHTVAGRRPAPCPSILGHEAVGEVVVAGSDIPAQVGDRIVWAVTVACGRCARCRAGFTAKCASVRKFGHEPFDSDWPLSGAYAEYVVLPRGASVARVPDTLTDAVAAPAACATATVMAALDAAEKITGRVLIYGAGMLGIAAAAACAEVGAQVHVHELDPARLELAREFGATPDTGEPMDLVFDFSGSSRAITGALERLGIGGTLVLAGSVTPGPAIGIDPETVVRRWHTITGVHNYEPHHLTQAIDFLERTNTTYAWETVVAQPVPLAEIASLFTSSSPGKLRMSCTP